MTYKTCLIQPFAKQLRNKKTNAKNFPYWPTLIPRLQQSGYELTQLLGPGEERLCKLPVLEGKLYEIEKFIESYDFFVGVDSFLQHMAAGHKKWGVVIWGKSDPDIFGYPENLNVYLSKDCMKRPQWFPWEEEPFDRKVFPNVEDIIKQVKVRFPIAK